jgi:hypothetical protein
MKISIETAAYNERRYGKPWIAKVDFSQQSQGEFLWGKWIGDIGCSGLLEVEAEEGDIVATGQKDFRKPSNSAPEWYQVQSGKLVSIGTRVDALRAFRAKNQV